MKKIYKCRKVSPGVVQGKALRSEDQILFYQTDPTTGAVIEHGHDLEGKSVQGMIVIFPGGKGSSVVQADGMYRLDQHGTAPLGLIVRDLDTVLVSSAIIMEMPMVCDVDLEFYENVKDRDWIEINTDDETVTIQT